MFLYATGCPWILYTVFEKKKGKKIKIKIKNNRQILYSMNYTCIALHTSTFNRHQHSSKLELKKKSTFYNPQKMSWNIQASLEEYGSPTPQCNVETCKCVQNISKVSQHWMVGAGEGKSISWNPSFLLIPILNILIHIKNTRLIWLEMPEVFQGLFEDCRYKVFTDTLYFGHKTSFLIFWNVMLLANVPLWCKVNNKDDKYYYWTRYTIVPNYWLDSKIYLFQYIL